MKVSLPTAGVWTKWPLKVSFNPNDSNCKSVIHMDGKKIIFNNTPGRYSKIIYDIYIIYNHIYNMWSLAQIPTKC